MTSHDRLQPRDYTNLGTSLSRKGQAYDWRSAVQVWPWKLASLMQSLAHYEQANLDRLRTTSDYDQT